MILDKFEKDKFYMQSSSAKLSRLLDPRSRNDPQTYRRSLKKSIYLSHEADLFGNILTTFSQSSPQCTVIGKLLSDDSYFFKNYQEEIKKFYMPGSFSNFN